MDNFTITLSGSGLQNTEAMTIHIAIDAMVNVSAQQARRKVTGWLVSEVGNMLIGGDPQLVINRQNDLWRVPVILTSSTDGRLEQVGMVDVNAENGDLFANDNVRKQILANIEDLIRSPLPSVT